MSFLERIGLASRPAASRMRRAGAKLEPTRPRPLGGASPRVRQGLWVRVCLFLGLVALAVLAHPQSASFSVTVNVGDAWQGRDVVAPFTFPIRLSSEELQARQDSLRFAVPPIFSDVADAEDRMNATADTLRERFASIFEAYGDWQRAIDRGSADEVDADSTRYLTLRRSIGVPIEPELWTLFADEYAARTPGLSSTTRTPQRGPRTDEVLLRYAQVFAIDLLPTGVLDVPKDSVVAAEIIARDDGSFRERRFLVDQVRGVDEAESYARNAFLQFFAQDQRLVDLGTSLFSVVLVPNLQFQAQATEAAYAEAEGDISGLRGQVSKGVVIVRRGDAITPEIKAQLESLGIESAERAGDTSWWRILIGRALLCAAALVIFFVYLYLLRRHLYMETRFVVLISLLFALALLAFALVVRLPSDLALSIPVAIVPILLTVIFDSRVGLLGTVTLAMLGGLIFGYEFAFAFATVFAGTFAVFSVRDVKNRSQIFITAALVFVAYLVVVGGTTLLRADPFDRLWDELLLISINALLLLFTYPLLWVFERTFNVTTDLTLLELSDTNRKLLKELSLRAPGTFNHSLQVANLAEAAADAVGANALRARVGALYHDIGKMLRPEYYIENQQPGENPHDSLTPYMSALIIASHVKDGAELARDREYGALPDTVRDFIPTHHGTTMMEYFYNRALEQRDEGDPEVEKADFRYPGPRPQTTEQGIVMLADSVEAASRSLKKPTPKRLESLIDGIMRARTEDGQLADTELTFADLTKIKETFLSILSGVYHFRVKYPDQRDDEGPDEGAVTQPGRTDGPSGDGATVSPPPPRRDPTPTQPLPPASEERPAPESPLS
ncbi:MAG: HDIG domain-containing metalloprotein [Bacteroidota bacterium]